MPRSPATAPRIADSRSSRAKNGARRKSANGNSIDKSSTPAKTKTKGFSFTPSSPSPPKAESAAPRSGALPAAHAAASATAPMNSQHGRITMRTIAERIGVTKTTVSLALRDHPSISAATKRRINDLAVELNYRPDPAIAAIAAQRWGCGSPERHRVIAFLTNSAPHLIGQQAFYLPGAKARAEELGYKLEPFFLDTYPTAESVNRVLYARGIRGILVPPIPNPDSRRAMHLDWSKFTAVCCGLGRVAPPLHTVSTDFFDTTRLIWEVVAKAGFRKIGATLFEHDPIAEEDWMRLGASSASIRFLGLNESAKIPFLTTEILDEEPLMEWYHKYKPEAIIGFNHAPGEILERNGVRIPGDVEFVALMAPSGSKWSGIAHSYDEISRTSVDVLNRELHDNHWGVPSLPNIVLIKPKWNPGTTFSGDAFAVEYAREGRALRSRNGSSGTRSVAAV